MTAASHIDSGGADRLAATRRPAISSAHGVSSRPARPAYLRLLDLAEWQAAQERGIEVNRGRGRWERMREARWMT